MKKVYTAQVHVTGGRDGKIKSSDDKLNLTLAMPKEFGGSGNGTNPEQLFAGGFAACFESAMRHIARQKKIPVKESSVNGIVWLNMLEPAGFSLGVRLEISLPGMERAAAQALVDAAHSVCPYSNATKGNIPVEIVLL